MGVKVKLTVDTVRLPKNSKAKRGTVKKGTTVELDKELAARLVFSKRAVYVDAKDAPKGALDTSSAAAATASGSS